MAVSRESTTSRAVIDESLNTTGAIILGRRTYDMGDKFDGFADTPYQMQHFVLTHHIPETRAKGSVPFTFVTDGIESALRQARTAAGEKDVVIGGGGNVAQQFLKAGLVDEIQIHLAPVLIGNGVRLFDQVDAELQQLRVIESSGVTHLRFRVVK
jgi:dihydrofolate reductase